eukprot:gene5570-7109_t
MDVFRLSSSNIITLPNEINAGEILNKLSRVQRLGALSATLVALTAVSGAFVAGNDAGRAFNSFPKMGDVWIPDDVLALTPTWRNIFENTSTVQFDHRILAITTFTAVNASYLWARFLHKDLWLVLPKHARLCFHLIAGLSWVQVGLGISTLLLYVPIPLAVLHQ